MKFSELLVIANNYDDALWSPSLLGVHFGCDCGCGGNSYTTESWDLANKFADQAIKAAQEFCQRHNIEYDGVKND